MAQTFIESKAELIAVLETGCKPKSAWAIGTEHEKLPFCSRTLKRLPYEGEKGIKALLMGLQRFDWQAVYENDNIIALEGENKGSISLEPGGQFELSGAPLKTLHQTCAEVHNHLAEVREIGQELGIGMLGLGFDPLWKRKEVPWMPKGRYGIMRDYMPKKGKLGLDMMLRSTTVQVNLDFSSEADMVKKFRVALALQPVATALFAGSPFLEGKPSGYKSYRAQLWQDTDPDRTGPAHFVFDEGMSFESYVDYALDVPMYFLYREGTYLDVSGQSFRDFMAGKLRGFEGQLPIINDFNNHLSTIFTDVRMKSFLEMRGADSGPWRAICALPAFWVGLLYDQEALDAAWDLIKPLTRDIRQELFNRAPKNALETLYDNDNKKLYDLACEAVAIAEQGLQNRAIYNEAGEDERAYLATLRRRLRDKMAPADRMLALYEGRWGGDVRHAYAEYAY